MSVKE
ncbi:hemocyanin E chain, partial [Trichonephila inaurata madagascariensis]